MQKSSDRFVDALFLMLQILQIYIIFYYNPAHLLQLYMSK